MEALILSSIIRGVNLILWAAVFGRILRNGLPINRFARSMVATVLLFGMAVLYIGGLVPFGLDAEVTRWLYTAFTAYAAIVALGILGE